MTAHRVPFIDLKPYVKLVGGFAGAPFADDVMSLLGSQEFIGGPTIHAFENKLATTLGTKHAVGCANGTDALVLALRALGVGHGSRVAIPGLTFWATYEAVIQIGATPVIIDVSPDDLQMDFIAFEHAYRKQEFDAAILVHLYGWCTGALAQFRSFCRERKIPLVEDGAQAFGVTSAGKSIFADADAITLSFHPAKVLGAVGDAGAVLTKHADVAERVRLLANHGRTGHYTHSVTGMNSRLDAIQAAWLLRALEVSSEVVTRRQVMSARYLGDGTGHGARSHSLDSPLGVAGNGYLNVTLAESAEHRDEMRAKLTAASVGYGTVYPTTIADQAGAGYARVIGDLPISRQVARTIINLPLFYGITDAQIDHVLEALT